MRILLAADRGTSFPGRYLYKMSEALLAGGHQATVLFARPSDERFSSTITVSDHAFEVAARERSASRYGHAIRVARAMGAERVHFVFVSSAEWRALHTAIVAAGEGAPGVSLSTFGLADPDPAAARALLAHPGVARVLVHSNFPERARAVASQHGLFSSTTAAFVHDPIYDDREHFAVAKEDARRALDLPLASSIGLYFGTLPRRKGIDLLLAAMRRVGDSPSPLLLCAGDRTTAPEGLLDGAAAANVRFTDGHLDYPTAALHFRAADWVVLPYRRDYRNDTSGVLVQAALAGRPVLVPAIPPFADVVTGNGTGELFECEDVSSLAAQIGRICGAPGLVGERWARYLDGIEPWSHLARLLTEAAGERATTCTEGRNVAVGE